MSESDDDTESEKETSSCDSFYPESQPGFDNIDIPVAEIVCTTKVSETKRANKTAKVNIKTAKKTNKRSTTKTPTEKEIQIDRAEKEGGVGHLSKRSNKGTDITSANKLMTQRQISKVSHQDETVNSGYESETVLYSNIESDTVLYSNTESDFNQYSQDEFSLQKNTELELRTISTSRSETPTIMFSNEEYDSLEYTSQDTAEKRCDLKNREHRKNETTKLTKKRNEAAENLKAKQLEEKKVKDKAMQSKVVQSDKSDEVHRKGKELQSDKSDEVHRKGKEQQSDKSDEVHHKGKELQSDKSDGVHRKGKEQQSDKSDEVNREGKDLQSDEVNQDGKELQSDEVNRPDEVNQDGKELQLDEVNRPDEVNQEGKELQSDEVNRPDEVNQEGKELQSDEVNRPDEVNQEGKDMQLDEVNQEGKDMQSDGVVNVENSQVKFEGKMSFEVTHGKSVIPRDFWPVNRKVTLFHVSAIVGKTKKLDEEYLNKMRENIEQKKMFAASYIRDYIRNIQLREALKEEIEHPKKGKVKKWSDLKLVWKDDPSKENVNKFFQVSWGAFDNMPRWKEELEKKFFSMMNWRYMDEPNRKKQCVGCFEELATYCHNDLNRQIYRPGKDFHGKYLTIYRRTSNIKDKQAKWWRRKRGIYEPHMLVDINGDTNIGMAESRNAGNMKDNVEKKEITTLQQELKKRDQEINSLKNTIIENTHQTECAHEMKKVAEKTNELRQTKECTKRKTPKKTNGRSVKEAAKHRNGAPTVGKSRNTRVNKKATARRKVNRQSNGDESEKQPTQRGQTSRAKQVGKKRTKLNTPRKGTKINVGKTVENVTETTPSTEKTQNDKKGDAMEEDTKEQNRKEIPEEPEPEDVGDSTETEEDNEESDVDDMKYLTEQWHPSLGMTYHQFCNKKRERNRKRLEKLGLNKIVKNMKGKSAKKQPESSRNKRKDDSDDEYIDSGSDIEPNPPKKLPRRYTRKALSNGSGGTDENEDGPRSLKKLPRGGIKKTMRNGSEDANGVGDGTMTLKKIPQRHTKKAQGHRSRYNDDVEDVPSEITSHAYLKDEKGVRSLYLNVDWTKFGNSQVKLEIFGEEYNHMVKEYVKKKRLKGNMWNKYRDQQVTKRKTIQKGKKDEKSKKSKPSTSRSGRKIKKTNMDIYLI